MTQRLTRRLFVRGAAGAAATLVAGSFNPRACAANEKLRCACIGVGGRGGAHVEAATKELLVALCDSDQQRLQAAARSVASHNAKVKTFSDYRKMFDEAHREFDVVFVGTPDHHHAPASMLAIKHGKHVYTEKPLTHSIYEARRLTEEARKAGVATQMGNQGMASEEHRRLCEYLWAGAIGPVREVHVWTDRPINWWPQGLNRPAYTDPIPKHLHWDLSRGFLHRLPRRPAGVVELRLRRQSDRGGVSGQRSDPGGPADRVGRREHETEELLGPGGPSRHPPRVPQRLEPLG